MRTPGERSATRNTAGETAFAYVAPVLEAFGYRRSLGCRPFLFRPGHRFERGAVCDLDQAFLHPNDADVLPFVETLADALARCAHESRELMLP